MKPTLTILAAALFAVAACEGPFEDLKRDLRRAAETEEDYEIGRADALSCFERTGSLEDCR